MKAPAVPVAIAPLQSTDWDDAWRDGLLMERRSPVAGYSGAGRRLAISR